MTLTPEQENALERVRAEARELIDAINEAATAGLSPAVIAPALVTVVQEAGIQIPAGVAGLVGRAFG